jgi:hypothetical protein
MSSRAALSGSLTDLPLPTLLPLVEATARSGVIELQGPGGAGLIVLDGGGITLALSDAGPTLPQVIVGSGIATAEEWERAHVVSLRGASLADALVEGGADEARLEAVLREQTIGALFEFLVPVGIDFAFLPGSTHPLGTRFCFDADELLAEAQERVDVWKVIAERIPSVTMVMRLTRDLAAPSITIDAADWTVLARVDGRATIAELIQDLGMSSFAVCGVLHRLLLAGAVEAVPSPSAPAVAR